MTIVTKQPAERASIDLHQASLRANSLGSGSFVFGLLESGSTSSDLETLKSIIEQATHLLPTQGPISVFIHHNPLHAFEDLPFDEAVLEGLRKFGGQPYLSEDRYRAELATGRISASDVAAVLMENLGDGCDQLLGFFGTRFHLRLAMLEHPMQLGTDAGLHWYMAESAALQRCRAECDPSTRVRMVQSVKKLARDHECPPQGRTGCDALVQQFLDIASRHHRGRWQSWDEATWESVTLQLLWQICQQRVGTVGNVNRHDQAPVRHRDYLLAATGCDIDAHVNPLMISFTGAFIDQGLATWALPNRDAGYFRAFIELFSDSSAPTEPWRIGLEETLRQLAKDQVSALQSIETSLQELGVAVEERKEYIAETLSPLRGWAGMIWQLETSATWTVRPAPAGTLIDFLAVRLLLERAALANVAREALKDRIPAGDSILLRELRPRLRRFLNTSAATSPFQHAFLVFQLAQVRGWLPINLVRMASTDWRILIAEMDGFSSLHRRHIYHLAYERRYSHSALDALALHAKAVGQSTKLTAASNSTPAKFQIVCCIDDREESFRRHLEEVAPECETFGVAGFFGLAMYYRGAAEAHFRPLCPAVIQPHHYVTERVGDSFESSHRNRAQGRRRLGEASHRFHLGTRSFFGGIVTSLAGSLAAAPMVGRILFPRFTAQLKRMASTVLQLPPNTRLILERSEPEPGPDLGHVGYTVGEMASIVKRTLEDMGVVGRLSRLVIFIGHGSSSLNNPHEAAYNCGACSGAKGGPNARGFAQMANDSRVRLDLLNRGVVIGPETVFVGALHNTCNDDVQYFDLDALPNSHRPDFENARKAIEEARGRNAWERCRRFESAGKVYSSEEALRHVETRSEDLSQARPEYNHATCAMLFVGRRQNTRGLYLDRRAFLVTYDPATDTAERSILARILAAAIPVCAGISLEYYFSCVDPVGYGCGSKLPHNIAALLGVMEGAASDLRTGLSSQMVEIHEPMRLLTLVEASEETMVSILQGNSGIDQLVRNGWIQLALMHPVSKVISRYSAGRFLPHHVETLSLPIAATSVDWYGTRRQHLGFAVIDPGPCLGETPAPQREREAAPLSPGSPAPVMRNPDIVDSVKGTR